MEIRNRGSDTLVVTVHSGLGDFVEFGRNEWSTCTIEDGMATVRNDAVFVACFMLDHVTMIERK